MSGILEMAGPWPMFLVGIGMVVVGAVYLALGWRLHMILLVAATVVGGGLLGLYAAREMHVATAPVALVTGMLCGLLSGVLKRFGLFVFGGLTAVVLLVDAGHLFQREYAYLFFLLIVFLGAGSLTVLFYDPAIVLATSILGSMGLIWGGLMCAESAVQGAGSTFALNHPRIMAILFFGLIVLGIVLQTRAMERREAEPGAAESVSD